LSNGAGQAVTAAAEADQSGKRGTFIFFPVLFEIPAYFAGYSIFLFQNIRKPKKTSKWVI